MSDALPQEGATVTPFRGGYTEAGSGGGSGAGGAAGGGGLPPELGGVWLQIAEAKIEASEHRVMSSVVGLRAELQAIIGAKSSRGDVWGGTAVIVATFLAIFGIWVAAFDSGAQLQGTVSDKIEEIQDLAEANTRAIEGLVVGDTRRDQTLDAILQALEIRSDQPQGGPQEGQN